MIRRNLFYFIFLSTVSIAFSQAVTLAPTAIYQSPDGEAFTLLMNVAAVKPVPILPWNTTFTPTRSYPAIPTFSPSSQFTDIPAACIIGSTCLKVPGLELNSNAFNSVSFAAIAAWASKSELRAAAAAANAVFEHLSVDNFALPNAIVNPNSESGVVDWLALKTGNNYINIGLDGDNGFSDVGDLCGPYDGRIFANDVASAIWEFFEALLEGVKGEGVPTRFQIETSSAKDFSIVPGMSRLMMFSISSKILDFGSLCYEGGWTWRG